MEEPLCCCKCSNSEFHLVGESARHGATSRNWLPLQNFSLNVSGSPFFSSRAWPCVTLSLIKSHTSFLRWCRAAVEVASCGSASKQAGNLTTYEVLPNPLEPALQCGKAGGNKQPWGGHLSEQHRARLKNVTFSILTGDVTRIKHVLPMALIFRRYLIKNLIYSP